DMFSLYWFNGVKEKFGRAVAIPGTTSEEASHTRNQTGNYDNGLHGFFKGELNHVFSPAFVGNVKYSYYDQGFSLTPQGGRDGDEQADRVNSIARGSSNLAGTVRPAHTLNSQRHYFVCHQQPK